MKQAAAIILVLSFTGSVLLARKLERMGAVSRPDEALYIPSPTVLKRVSLGYDGLLADLYWTRSVQYFGYQHSLKARQYPLLAPLLDITTELDPNLLIAYQFGGIFLAQPPPEGAGQPEEAIKLVRRGIRANPKAWRLYFSLGWIEYDRKNYRAAAEAYELGSRIPGAAPSMKVMSAITAQHGGEKETARFLWSQLYETSDDSQLRDTAVQHLRSMRVDDDIEQLEQLVAAYRERFGHDPGSWAELEALGWRGPFVDPMGNAYVLRAGRVEAQNPQDFPFTTRGAQSGEVPPSP